VSRVVANHDDFEQSTVRHLGRECSMVTHNPNSPNSRITQKGTQNISGNDPRAIFLSPTARRDVGECPGSLPAREACLLSLRIPLFDVF
jgi:hypothetical protein